MLLPVAQEAAVGKALRTLLDSNGFTDVKVIGYDHNWDNAGTYPVQLVSCVQAPHHPLTKRQMQQAGSAFAGVAFHCYGGDFTSQASFTSAYPSKEVYFTECTGTVGTDWWSNIKWNMYHLWAHPTLIRSYILLIGQ